MLSLWSVYKWIEKFKNGHTNVTHDKGAERPSTAITEDNIKLARDMVLLAALVVLRRWRMRGFIVIISEQV